MLPTIGGVGTIFSGMGNAPGSAYGYRSISHSEKIVTTIDMSTCSLVYCLHRSLSEASPQILRFRFDLPEGLAQMAPTEYTTDLTSELRERLRRNLQAATQQMQTALLPDLKRQTMKLSVVHDAFLTLGQFLFETLLPKPIQEALRHLDDTLILNTNTPEIPWELLFDDEPSPGRFLCQYLSIGRLSQQNLTGDVPNRSATGSLQDRSAERGRKQGRTAPQGLSVLFLVNPTGERPLAEEEVAALCTTLPESVSRNILYRQQANQLEIRMRVNSDSPQVLHYAGPFPITTSSGDAALALPGRTTISVSPPTSTRFLEPP